MIALFAGFVLFSCNSNPVSSSEESDNGKSVCDVANPIEDLPWLKSEVSKMSAEETPDFSYFVNQAEYKDQIVFTFTNNNPVGIYQVKYYNCKGEVICSDITGCRDIIDNSMNLKVIWESK